MIVIIAILLLLLLFGGGRVLGCAWHLFVAGVIVILVLFVLAVLGFGHAAFRPIRRRPSGPVLMQPLARPELQINGGLGVSPRFLSSL